MQKTKRKPRAKLPPAKPETLREGSVVFLKSGGPPMTVVSLTESTVTCCHLETVRGKGTMFQQRTFHRSSVSLSPVAWKRSFEIAAQVLGAFQDNSSYDDYKREDKWTDAEYAEMVELFKKESIW